MFLVEYHTNYQNLYLSTFLLFKTESRTENPKQDVFTSVLHFFTYFIKIAVLAEINGIKLQNSEIVSVDFTLREIMIQ